MVQRLDGLHRPFAERLATQHQGVLPDVAFPSIIDTKEIGESALPEAMPWDTIRPAIKPAVDPFKPYIDKLKAEMSF